MSSKSFNQSVAKSVKSSLAAKGGVSAARSSSNVYWAKGTGFGTGSTDQSWDIALDLSRQKMEEERVTVLLQVKIRI